MRLRTFTAPDMPSAMKMVREAMGDDAVIISSGPVNGKSISVTAAIDLAEEQIADSRPFEPITTRDSVPDDLRFALHNIFRFHNLPELFIAKILQKASEGAFASAMALHRSSRQSTESRLHLLAMEKLLGAFFTFEPLTLDSGTSRMMLIGSPGIGKTLTCAKIAARMTLAKKPIALITTDNKRAGGIEQLLAFTSILGIELQVANSRTELWKILKSIPSNMNVIVDTAGCNPYDDKEWKETQSYASIEDIEPVIVLPSGGDSLEAIDMTEIFASLPVRRMIVTRADTTRRFGGVLAASAAHGFSFAHASTSSSMADSLFPMDSKLLAQLLLRYQAQPH